MINNQVAEHANIVSFFVCGFGSEIQKTRQWEGKGSYLQKSIKLEIGLGNMHVSLPSTCASKTDSTNTPVDR